MSENSYKRLTEHLRESWWALPEAEELMPLLKVTYTPEEAELLADLPYSPTYLEDFAAMKKKDPAEVQEKLDDMADRGLVFRTERGGKRRYKINDSYFFFYRSAFWGGQDDEWHRAMAQLVNKYHLNGFYDKWELTHWKGLRVLPIRDTIADTRKIVPYQDAVKVLESAYHFSVSTCPCRQRKKLDPDSPDCQYPGPDGSYEVCLHFDRLSEYIVTSGLGREITRAEAGEILRRCAGAGLVHGISNWREGPDTICNCCRDCCLLFEGFHKLGQTESFTPSDYMVSVNEATCIGCGLCVKRCHMGALSLEERPGAKGRVTVIEGRELRNKGGKVCALQPELCIGCGVCAYTCPTKSLVLEARGTVEDIPSTPREHGERLAADFVRGKATQ
jgi:NAD-dependent dihydropyrimidine dehydrogenase PreA subunit